MILTPFYLSIHQLIHTCAVSTLGLLYPHEHSSTCLWICVFSSVGFIPRSGIGNSILTFWEAVRLFSMVAAWFCNPPKDLEGCSYAAAESLQSCPTLCDPIDGSPLASSVSGILQARILEWVAISFSNAWKWKANVKPLSHAHLLVTPWTAAYQAPPSMGFCRQEYWSGVPLPSLMFK